eukprot:10060465-Karenia_brevis.AAC.1
MFSERIAYVRDAQGGQYSCVPDIFCEGSSHPGSMHSNSFWGYYCTLDNPSERARFSVCMHGPFTEAVVGEAVCDWETCQHSESLYKGESACAQSAA